MKFLRISRSTAVPRILASTLSLLLAGSPAGAQNLPSAINISAVQGDGATGRVRQPSSQAPVIRVVDEKELPVVGAAVVFTLPTEGPTGSFGNGSKTLTLMTDSRGVATVHGLRFNQIPGKVPIHVNASYRGLTARAIVTQISEAPAGYKPGGSSAGKVIGILAILAAAGGGGAYYVRSQNKSASSPAPPPVPSSIGVTPGSGTIAPPR